MEQQNKFQFGPALAIVIIVGVVAIAGLYLYKGIMQDLSQGSDTELLIPEGYFESRQSQNIQSNDDLSTSTDLNTIEGELDATLEADLSALDNLDEQLLDFDDLDELDFEI